MTTKHGVVVLIIKNGKFLLLRDSRDLMLGHWGPPHGRCEESDKNEEGAITREVFEETGLTVKPLKNIWTTKADTKVETVSFWLAEIIEGNVLIDKQESSEYGWFSIDEALRLKLYPGTLNFFTLVKQGLIII